MIYSVMTTVIKVEECFRTHHVSGVGGAAGDPIKSPNPATFRQESLGWFVHFEGSYEAIFMGDTCPAFNPGDRVKVTFEKVT